MHPHDRVIIIGSGIGGMTAAIVLARLGHRVTVVEKNRQPGGLMRSYTRKGFEFEVGIHYIGAMDKGQPLSQIFDLLGISGRISAERMGNEGIVDRYVLPDRVFDFPPGIDLYEENLRKSFPDQGRQITEVTALLRSAMARLGRMTAFLKGEAEFNLSQELQPVEDYFNKVGCSPGLGTVLSIPLTWVGVTPRECPLYLWSSSISSYLMSSWRLTVGGAQLADALAARLRELGGEIICNDDVIRITVKDRAVQGVVLKSGKELDAPVVISAVHPKLMLNMLPDDSYKPAFRNKIQSLQETPGIFAAHVAVPENEVPYRSYNIFALDWENERHWQQGSGAFFNMKRSLKPGWNTVSVLTESPYETWRRWEHTTKDHRPDDYREAKARESEALMRRALHYFGPAPGARIVDAFTPLSFRDWVGSPEGGAYGVCHTVKQKFKTAALHRTPIAGLHAVGQSVFAPGILGTALGALRVIAEMVGYDTLHLKLIDSQREEI